jgi:hypothetical protein
MGDGDQAARTFCASGIGASPADVVSDVSDE